MFDNDVAIQTLHIGIKLFEKHGITLDHTEFLFLSI